MDSKENALRIIYFDNPEQVVENPGLYLTRYHGARTEDTANGEDVSYFGAKWLDPWGTAWHNVHEGIIGYPIAHPIPEPKDLAHYTWLDPDDERVCGKIYEMADAYAFPDDGLFLAGSHHHTLWERAYMLVGMENMMCHFYTEPDFAKEILQRIMDFQLGIAEHYANVGVEFVRLSDDLGTQQGPLLGPRIVSEFLLPQYRRLFRFYKERDVLISFHACGNLTSIIDTLIDLGVDVLDPVQASANDLGRIRAATQGRMALQGGVSSATIMEGPVERIVDEVRQRLWQLGRDGGYFCWRDQYMPYPLAHIDAVHEAVEMYGRYPIQPYLESSESPRTSSATDWSLSI